MLFNAHLLNRYRVAGYGGFVCIDISSFYTNLAALMLIFTFLSTFIKYMLLGILCIEYFCTQYSDSRYQYSGRYQYNVLIFFCRYRLPDTKIFLSTTNQNLSVWKIMLHGSLVTRDCLI